MTFVFDSCNSCYSWFSYSLLSCDELNSIRRMI